MTPGDAGPLLPGATIGILGGGQLGRMLAMAAARLGYRCHVFAPGGDSVAAEVSHDFTRADYGDERALDRFAAKLDVVTYEFENVPPAAVARLAERVAVHPSVKSLEVAQDRRAEKRFVAALGGRTATWLAVDSRAELDRTIASVGLPAILKTRRFGYDGKGQARIARADDADAAWDAIRGRPAILEALVPFEAEFSVILARGRHGESVVWDTPENVHGDGLLVTSTVPARDLIARQSNVAIALARKVADALGHVGVLTLEFFATADGPLFNEMAPRVHNSGHWTIEGAATSQFENHVRAICGLPLGPTKRAGKRIEMENLVGDTASRWPAILADPRARLHLYGKQGAEPGRKMGHVTRLF